MYLNLVKFSCRIGFVSVKDSKPKKKNGVTCSVSLFKMTFNKWGGNDGGTSSPVIGRARS